MERKGDGPPLQWRKRGREMGGDTLLEQLIRGLNVETLDHLISFSLTTVPYYGNKFFGTTHHHSTPPVASILFTPFSLLKLLSEFFRPCINEPIAAHTKFRPTSETGPEALRRISLTETHLKRPRHNSYFGMVSWDSSELRRSLYTIL